MDNITSLGDESQTDKLKPVPANNNWRKNSDSCQRPGKMDDLDSPRATARVFSTPELLESILIYTINCRQIDEVEVLEMRNLFKAQRVNKSFRDMITTSKKLRRVLFFENDEQDSSLQRSNPLIPHVFPLVIRHKFYAAEHGIGSLSCEIRLEKNGSPPFAFPREGSWGQALVWNTPARVLLLVDITREGSKREWGFVGALAPGSTLVEVADKLANFQKRLVKRNLGRQRASR